MITATETNTSKMMSYTDAYYPLVQLAQPHRDLFETYCRNESKPRPMYAIEPYLLSNKASQIGLSMGDKIKKFLLKDVHHTKQKEMLKSGITQAYLDVCLAVSVADYCLEDIGNPINYSEYLSACIEAINLCFKNITPFEMIPPVRIENAVDSGLQKIVQMAKNKEQAQAIALTRVESAFKILDLWMNKKLSHDIEYDELLEQLEDNVADSKALKALPYLLTVQRNKIEFIAEEIEQADMMMRTIVTENALQQFKNNIPDKTPDVEQTRNFLVRNKQQPISLDELN